MGVLHTIFYSKIYIKRGRKGGDKYNFSFMMMDSLGCFQDKSSHVFKNNISNKSVHELSHKKVIK